GIRHFRSVQPVQSRELWRIYDKRKQCELRQAIVHRQSGVSTENAATGISHDLLGRKFQSYCAMSELCSHVTVCRDFYRGAIDRIEPTWSLTVPQYSGRLMI